MSQYSDGFWNIWYAVKWVAYLVTVGAVIWYLASH